VVVWNSSNISEVHAASTFRVKVCTVAKFLPIHRFLFWKITCGGGGVHWRPVWANGECGTGKMCKKSSSPFKDHRVNQKTSATGALKSSPMMSTWMGDPLGTPVAVGFLVHL
jgi:hypothetical protein